MQKFEEGLIYLKMLFCLVSLQNELSVYELVHNFVEVLDKYFSRVVSADQTLKNVTAPVFVKEHSVITFVYFFSLQSELDVSFYLN